VRLNDLIVVTSYYNPESYATRKYNYELFAAHLKDIGVPLLTVECAFGDQTFQLTSSPYTIQIRSQSVLWQKERLLNIGIRSAPASYTKIAWLDADLLFEDCECFQQASDLLNEFPVVQPFETVTRLPRNQLLFTENCTSWIGFAARIHASPGCHLKGWFRHGHTGYAWAARREVFNSCGLFDKCVSGGSDHLMAHAFLGDWYSKCIDDLVGLGSPLHSSFRIWARAVHRSVLGRIGYVPGRVLHLWHGNEANRAYHKWSQEMKKCRLDPDLDLTDNADGCLEWTGRNKRIQHWSTALFPGRKEDG
jgi:hypothetical protein